jgi:ATP-dependent RNA helicase RhlB
MPSFIQKITGLFKKQEVYRPSQAQTPAKPAATGAKKPAARPQPKAEEPRRHRTHRGGRGSRPDDAPPREQTRPPEKQKTVWDPASFQVEPQEGKTRFQDLNLPADVLHAIADLNFKYCTPIQAEILPLTLAGKDMAGKAQTGTGKTAAFLLGILTRFINQRQEAPAPGSPRALILAPTRELAMQIRDDAEKLSKYTPFKTVAVYGGIDYDKQRRMLEQPVDIIVATPGRLIDFASQGALNLRNVEVLVIDEADRMLDMGFIPDVRKIVYKTPPKENRQTLLFSATLDDEVMRLAAAWMVDPGKIEIAQDHAATKLIDQQVYIVTDDQKFALLYNILKKEVGDGSAIIFTNRRDQAERLSDALYRYGIDSQMLSGAVAQNKRQRILSDFKDGRCKLVVATDVAGRGIHVDDITHVINFNIPSQPDDYVHRIGRTGRAGKTGISVTFACEMESFELPAIEELLGKHLPCIMPEPDMLHLPEPVRKAPHRESRPPQGGRGGDRRGGSRPPRRDHGPRR